MPTIKSRKYDNVQYVSAETWAEMKEKGIARRFRIEDDQDLQDTIIKAPKEIVNFGKPDRKKILREEIKALLDEREIEYNSRTSTVNLEKLLNENNGTE